MENTQHQTDTYSLSIMTDRNQALAATVYRPKNEMKAAVMIAPATGIKRQFYHNFATYLAESGFGVLTFDNEGIGESLSSALAKCDASLISWGRHDMPAVLDALQDEFSDVTYHLIGHSAGGQLIGLMPNYKAIASVFNVACSSGQIKNMAMPYKLKAMGFMDAFGKSIHTHFYDELDMPALWLGFSDDEIANSKNMDDMIRVFTKMPVEKRFFEPKEFGLNSIGHMRYFSSRTHAKAPQLWQMTVDWLNKQQ